MLAERSGPVVALPINQGGVTVPDSPSPTALGFAWAYRILAVAAEMVLPGVLGGWLDGRWGTHYLALAGFGLGITLGVTHLLLMTRAHARELSQKHGFRDDERDERRT